MKEEVKATVRIIERKIFGKWEEYVVIDDVAAVWESLARDLISKKINKCRYIRSITRKCNFNGTQTITVIHDNDTRSVYIIPEG